MTRICCFSTATTNADMLFIIALGDTNYFLYFFAKQVEISFLVDCGER